MTRRRRKICVVTGSRAEYGLLYWLLNDLQHHAGVTLQLVVTGMHLSSQFGLTVREIEADGFVPDAKVDMLVSSDTPAGIAKSIGLGTIGFAGVLEQLQPDMLVVLGDRFEIFAAAQAAMCARIPIAHIHGGELTEGLIDEAIRHAITKMSHLHFVAAEEYRNRVIQLGESPDRVWNVGALGVEAIRRTRLLSRVALSKAIGFDISQPYFLVTYHPVTLHHHGDGGGVRPLLKAFEAFPQHRIVLTGVNADTDNVGIREAIQSFARKHAQRVHATMSLGQQGYLSAMRYADAVVGNSSSGLIEAPSFRVPTVNIGDRQRGRVRAKTVIDVAADEGAIVAGINKALSPVFRAHLRRTVSPFGDGQSVARIAKILATHPLHDLLMKQFWDLPR